MTAGMFVQMVERGDLDGLEMHCMEAIQKGGLNLAEMGPAFRKLERVKERERVSSLGRMLLENEAAQADPAALLPVARATLIAAPDDAALRARVVDLYRTVYGEVPGFDKLLEQSGIEDGRAPRTALRLIDVCLGLKKGDVLLSRSDDVVIEVIDVELESGLVTVRRDGRPRSMSGSDLSRDFEPIDADDFRVLRALRPDRLRELLVSDPVQVVIGLLRAHEGRLDQDQLKHELTPLYIAERDWAKWWTKAREALKRCPNVTLEGRSPVILTFTAQAITMEDETWTAFQTKREPAEWLSIVDSYFRDRKAAGETPEPALLERFRGLLREKITVLTSRRPTEALECALLLERIDAAAGVSDGPRPAHEFLQAATKPAELLSAIHLEAFWSMATEAVLAARPADAAALLVEIMPKAPAGALDRIVKAAQDTPHLLRVQDHVDTAVADPVRFPEIIYWLWKGPAKGHGIKLPEDDTLFQRIVETLVALDRTLHVPPAMAKEFRLRTRTALALRSAARAEACLVRIGGHRAVTLRHQLERLEGLGDTLPSKMLNKLREVHPELWYVAPTRMEPWEDPAVVFSTKAGISAKTEERDDLVNVKMRDNARRIGEAASLGDLSENSEYKFALEERDLLRARLAQVNHDLSIAQEIDPLDVPTARVGVGSRVKLRLASGKERVMTFLGPFDAQPERNVYNYKAPISLKLMGLQVGDKATIGLDGEDVDVEVLEISNGLK